MSESNLMALNNALHEQLQRLNNAELKGDALDQEIQRAAAVVGVSREIVSTARTVLDSEKLRAEYQGLTSDTDGTLRLEKL